MRSREAIAEEVRALLARRQLSQQQLAEAVGMSQAALSERVRGLKAFDLDQLEAVAEYLGTTVEEIVIAARRSAVPA